mmetsp:Transcript_3175/g.9199  ORF Transcript_3175/g.9199 Transcript_3175/m.9199 type:complete len:264 (-) Transcript_3175:267-1058(-)
MLALVHSLLERLFLEVAVLSEGLHGLELLTLLRGLELAPVQLGLLHGRHLLGLVNLGQECTQPARSSSSSPWGGSCRGFGGSSRAGDPAVERPHGGEGLRGLEATAKVRSLGPSAPSTSGNSECEFLLGANPHITVYIDLLPSEVLGLRDGDETRPLAGFHVGVAVLEGHGVVASGLGKLFGATCGCCAPLRRLGTRHTAHAKTTTKATACGARACGRLFRGRGRVHLRPDIVHGRPLGRRSEFGSRWCALLGRGRAVELCPQ